MPITTNPNFYSKPTDELGMYLKMDTFAPLFEDMLFSPGSITGELLSETILRTSGEPVGKMYLSRPIDLEYFSYDDVPIVIDTLPEGVEGSYNLQDGTLTFSPETSHNDSTVLHEMIHMHENLLKKLPVVYHEALLLELYKSLCSRIPDLDERIFMHGHPLHQADISETGGLHDILFMLKSFDLDLRMGYPLGTVFGYGMTES